MSVRTAWLVVALFAAFTAWFVLGAVGRIVDRELDLWTPATAPGATAVPYQEEP